MPTRSKRKASAGRDTPLTEHKFCPIMAIRTLILLDAGWRSVFGSNHHPSTTGGASMGRPKKFRKPKNISFTVETQNIKPCAEGREKGAISE